MSYAKGDRCTVEEWGWCYRSNGRFWGVVGKGYELTYQDVCDSIVNAGRKDIDIRILDAGGRPVSVGRFVVDTK